MGGIGCRPNVLMSRIDSLSATMLLVQVGTRVVSLKQRVVQRKVLVVGLVEGMHLLPVRYLPIDRELFLLLAYICW